MSTICSSASGPEAGALLNRMERHFARHLVVTSAQRHVLALWALHTWVYKRFQHTPRLAVISPQKRCGKSTVLDLLRAFSHAPTKADSASEASIFRLVAKQSGGITLLIDEADSFLPSQPGLRNVLNSGFEASGSTLRTVKAKDNHEPQAFSTFCPVAIAAIGELPDTVGDRAVPIRLRRKMEGEHVEKVRRHREAIAQTAAKIAKWAASVDLSAFLDPAIPEGFGDRQADIAVPLLAIADHAGGTWPEQARAALKEAFRTDEEESEAAILLADIRAIFTEEGDEKLASATLCDALAKMEGRPWPEFVHGKAITPNRTAQILRPFGIAPSNLRQGESVVKGYHRSDFQDAWNRYLPATQADPVAV